MIAISFRSEMALAREAVIAAIEQDCRLIPNLVGREVRTDLITDQILNGLHRCDVVVADVTENKSGVYFEAGYGMALGKPVIFTVHEDRFKTDVHFDTSHWEWAPLKKPLHKTGWQVRWLVRLSPFSP